MSELCAVVGIYQSRPYLKISQDYPNAKRSIKEVKNYSSGPIAWFAASSENRIWGPITSFARKHVHSQNEDVFFPGGVIFVLAVIGLMAPFYTKRLRIGLAAGIVIVSVLALGFAAPALWGACVPAVALRFGAAPAAFVFAGDASARTAVTAAVVVALLLCAETVSASCCKLQVARPSSPYSSTSACTRLAHSATPPLGAR